MSNKIKELFDQLAVAVGVNMDATKADAEDLQKRADEAGLATKAIDAESGQKALEAVKALEETIAKQAGVISTLTAQLAEQATALTEIREGQKAQAARAVKALDDVKGLLAQMNVKPTIQEDAEAQAKLKAADEATKEKVEKAQQISGSENSLALKFNRKPAS